MFSKDFRNGEVTINELYSMQSEVWGKKNIELFGITKVSSTNPFIVRESLSRDQDTYWNSGTCKLKEKLINDNVIKDSACMIRNSFVLEFNDINNLIGLSSLFIYEASINDKRCTNKELTDLVEKINAIDDLDAIYKILMDKKYEGYEFEPQKARIAYLPLVTEIGYKLGNSEYSLRTQATRNQFTLRKINGVVKQKGWEYKDGKFKDGKNHFCDVGEHNYPLLNAILGEQVTEENFTKALDKMPEYNRSTALYFSFRWFEEVEQSVLHPTCKFINAQKGRVINYAAAINAPRRFSKRNMQDLCNNLVLVKSKMKALEMSRSILFAPVNEYARSFSFTDVDRLFDAFKTTTNALAGRARVLLDNIYVEDSMLKCSYGGKEYTQYDIILGNIPDELKNGSSLSSLSRAPYNYLNDAKRIMFCAKLRSQAVRVNGQVDDLTHEVPARVVFADDKGFSFGDSFVISESFAKKLERNVHKTFDLDKKSLSNFSVGQEISTELLSKLEKKNRFSSWRDAHIENITNEYIDVHARAPFGVGDKITNLHGSKGIVSIILPDDQMPYLKNDLSENMPAGPIDVIVPGISVFRRKSTGQVFEAISQALGFGEMTLHELKNTHGKEIEEYDKKSVFSYRGKEFSAPCGINHFIRLDHDATSKQSFAYIKTNSKYNLHIAEMELLNLAARGMYGILNELDIRSLNKHTNSFSKIAKMQETGRCPEEQMNMPYFSDYMKYLGWNFNSNQPLSKEDIEAYWKDLFEIVNNNEVDIFSEVDTDSSSD